MEKRTETRVERVMREIRERISSRQLAVGAALPSIRKFAETMQVSKSTAVEAYDRLAAEGLIQSRRGAGFFVVGPLLPLSLQQIAPKLDRAIDPLWVSRQSLEAGDDFLKPGCGWLPASWMPEEAIRRALRGLARADQSTLVDYGTPLGFAPLRQLLSRRLAAQNIDAMPEHIVLMESGTQAIDLLCRFFLEPGDTVLVDDPCYFNFRALLKAHQAKIVSVRYTPDGPDLQDFGAALSEHKPRLYITNSGVHNPTGATLSPATAHHLLKLAEQAKLTIIEDDIFGDLETAPAPRLAAFDGLQQVVHIGSFSKTLSAAIRCGYIAAKAEWTEGLSDLKIATSFGGGPFSAELTWRVLTDSAYQKHLDELRRKLSQCQQQTSQRLQQLGIEPWLQPRAGMYLWSQLPPGKDAATIAQRALVEGVVLAPGNAFSHAGSAERFLRFNVAQSQSERIFSVLQKLLDD